MADRRTDDQPLAPRRPLTGPAQSQPADAPGQAARNATRTQDPSTEAPRRDGQPRSNVGTPKGATDTGTRPPEAGAKPVEPTAKPADAGAKPAQPAAKPAQGGGRPATSTSRPAEAGNRPIPAPSQTQAGNKSGTAPSTSAGVGHKPDVTPSSPSQAGNSPGTKPPVTERVSQKVSQAVSAATETVRNAAETRRTEPRSPSAPPAGNRPGSGSARPRTRKARLRMTHIDPWSVMKTAFLLSIAIGVVTVIAVAMVWSVLGAAGVWDSINKTVQEVIGGGSGSAFNVEDYIGTSRVLGFTMIVAVVDVVLMTAIATLGAFLYNLAATLLGGIEVTLAEEDR